jgi:hypothetical protein
MRVNGRIINNMVMDMRVGVMVQYIRDNFLRGKRMDKDF